MNCALPRNASVGLSFDKPTKCQTHLAKLSDINLLMQRALGGDVSVFRPVKYLDVSDCPESLQDALNAQRKAIEAYDALPLAVRERYTSPKAFYDAACDPSARQDFVKFGLAFRPEKDGAIKVEVVNSVTPKGAESANGSACA